MQTFTPHKHYCDRLPLRGAMSLTAALLLTSQSAAGASVEGQIKNSEGEPLYKVAVCLVAQSTPDKCAKTRSTDKFGGYAFTGLKDEAYSIIVNGDRAAASRKFQVYSNYAWEPAQATVTFSSKNEKITDVDFSGKFNFSNFQRAVNLNSSDFPELDSFVQAGEYFVLNVFYTSATDQSKIDIFLNSVGNPDNFQIAASIPLPISEINYQIYSATTSSTGSIAIN